MTPKSFFLLLLMVSLTFVASCQEASENGHSASSTNTPSDPSSDSENPKLLSPALFQKALLDDPHIQLIDVRTPREFMSGHLIGATNLNIQDRDFISQIKALDPNKPVLVYCHLGGRSGRAAQELSALGYKVYDLKGGMSAWLETSLPIEKP